MSSWSHCWSEVAGTLCTSRSRLSRSSSRTLKRSAARGWSRCRMSRWRTRRESYRRILKERSSQTTRNWRTTRRSRGTRNSGGHTRRTHRENRRSHWGKRGRSREMIRRLGGCKIRRADCWRRPSRPRQSAKGLRSLTDRRWNRGIPAWPEDWILRCHTPPVHDHQKRRMMKRRMSWQRSCYHRAVQKSRDQSWKMTDWRVRCYRHWCWSTYSVPNVRPERHPEDSMDREPIRERCIRMQDRKRSWHWVKPTSSCRFHGHRNYEGQYVPGKSRRTNRPGCNRNSDPGERKPPSRERIRAMGKSGSDRRDRACPSATTESDEADSRRGYLCSVRRTRRSPAPETPTRRRLALSHFSSHVTF